MGIKNLNRYLLDNCSNKAIHKIHLSELRNKRVVIDTSIYLYKYAADNALIENMYLLISILKHYKINPIFVFDGKPPVEKKDLLRERRQIKNDAFQKYTEIKDKKDLNRKDIKEMEYLKRQFVQIKDEDIKSVKNLMDIYGISYCTATGEADQLCAYFMNTNQCWACISDDMDMFVYGCERVIRGIGLLNQDRKSTRLNSSHLRLSRMPSSA